MTTEENNPEGSRVVAMLETIKDLRTCTEIIKDLLTELHLGFDTSASGRATGAQRREGAERRENGAGHASARGCR